MDAVRGIFTDLLGDLPGVLALDRCEQADEVGPDAIMGLVSGEPGPEPLGDRIEFTAPLTDLFGVNDGAGAGNSEPTWTIPCQTNLNRITNCHCSTNKIILKKCLPFSTAQINHVA
jgi:hypothetical protein